MVIANVRNTKIGILENLQLVFGPSNTYCSTLDIHLWAFIYLGHVYWPTLAVIFDEGWMFYAWAERAELSLHIKRTKLIPSPVWLACAAGIQISGPNGPIASKGTGLVGPEGPHWWPTQPFLAWAPRSRSVRIPGRWNTQFCWAWSGFLLNLSSSATSPKQAHPKMSTARVRMQFRLGPVFKMAVLVFVHLNWALVPNFIHHMNLYSCLHTFSWAGLGLYQIVERPTKVAPIHLCPSWRWLMVSTRSPLGTNYN